MPNQTRNVIVGAASVFISRIDSLTGGTNWDTLALPATVPGTPFADTLDTGAGASSYRSTGFTSTGVDFAYTPTYGVVEVDQLLDVAKMFKDKMTAVVKTTFVEATLENLLTVWAQGPSSLRWSGATATTDISGRTVVPTNDFNGVTVPVNEQVLGVEAGALGLEPVERQVVFVGTAPRTATGNIKRERIYHLRRALSVDPTSHFLQRSAATIFPVAFRILPGSVSGAEYGTIRDRVI